MPGRFPKLILSEFFRNVVTLISGTTLAQIISLAIYLVITRIYTPEDLGVFALFMSIITITVILASGRYELAVMLPRKDSDSVNLLALCGVLSVFISLLLLLAVFLFNDSFTRILGNETIGFWLYFVPLATFMNGIYQSLNYWSNRNKRYRNITAANLGQSLVNSVVKLGLGALVAGPLGLITGTLAGQAGGGSIFAGSFLKNDRDKLSLINRSGVRKMAREYSLFPKFNMPHAILNNLSGNLPIFIFTSYFGSAAAGLYSLGFTMIFRPLNLVAGAFKQVLSQQIIQKQNSGKPIMDDLKKVRKKLLQFSAVPFLLVGIFTPALFGFAFGSDWEEAGRYTRLIMPWLFLVLLTIPYSFIPDLFRKQRQAMIIEAVKLVLRIFALAAGVYVKDIYLAIMLFGGISLLVSGYQMIWYFRLAADADAEKRDK